MEGRVSEPLYIARAEIQKVDGDHRRARIATGVDVDFGVHGPIKEHFRLDSRKNLPLPVDYIAAATGA
jgi:hypothetical protein